MKSLPSLLSGGGLLLAATLAAAAAVEAVQLRYQFEPGATNAYRVSFEATSGEQTSAVAGVVFVRVRKVEEGVGTLGFNGSLVPRSAPGVSPMMGMPFRPIGGPWMPRHLVLQPNAEIRVDELGRVVRQWSYGPGLPLPFGNVMGLFFQPVPAAASVAWDSAGAVWIEDETATDDMPGRYMGPYGDNRSAHQLAALRTEKARITEVTETTATIESRVGCRARRSRPGNRASRRSVKGRLS
jgi:hypothetical protein